MDKENEADNNLPPKESPPQPAVEDTTTMPKKNLIKNERKKFPLNLPTDLNVVMGENGTAYSVQGERNAYGLPVGSIDLDNILFELCLEEGRTPSPNDISKLNHLLQAHAGRSAVTQPVWNRVAHLPDGIEIDLGDPKHTRIRITPGKVEIITEGSDVLFCRPAVSRPMAFPAETGNLRLVNKYINLHPVHRTLLIGWISYTLAHPKIDTSNYLILNLHGPQGSGKSSLCRTIIRLIDPNRVGNQAMAFKPEDFVIAAMNAHALCYDNLRAFSQKWSDLLCIAATGGSTSSRRLYTNSEQQANKLHVALILNGIHPFIDQPDLAQRALSLEVLPISENNRRSETALMEEFEEDLPKIQRGLFDLIAENFKHLPNVKVMYPERMIDFCRWLAAMEMSHGAPEGAYQLEYSNLINQGQRDTVLDNPLGAAIYEFAENEVNGEWSDTPTALLNKLNTRTDWSTQRSREWPRSAISLSKRLAPLQAPLMSQGISVEFTRGKQRTITITNNSEELY